MLGPLVWAILLSPASAQRALTLPATPIAGAALAAVAARPAASLPQPAVLGRSLAKTALALPSRLLVPSSLPAFFDGAAAAEPHATLVETARPWRTRAQLDRLAKAAPVAGPVRFQVIGDAEPGRFFFSRLLFNKPGVFERQLASAHARGGDFVIQLGDMVSRGLAKNFRALFELLGRVGAPNPYLTVLGNHDRRYPHGVSDSRVYQSLFGSPNYWFERGGVRFVVVDSSAGRILPRQLKWLDGALAADQTKIVFTHMPPVQLKAWTRGVGGFATGSSEFADIVRRRGVSRVYVGHVHGLATLEYRGVRYVLSGGGGSPLYPGTVKRRLHHTLSVEVDGGEVREVVHPLDGPPFPL